MERSDDRHQGKSERPATTARGQVGEGLKLARLMMVLGGLAPLFALWAIRGVPVIPDLPFVGICVFLIAVPNALLLYRISVARKHDDLKTLTIRNATDNREHLLVYLFAMLIPLYDANLGTTRDFIATVCAFVFIVFLFWRLNLHYMNIAFALRGYKVFTIEPDIGAADANSGRESFVLITKRPRLDEGEEISALRISDTVYFEPNLLR